MPTVFAAVRLWHGSLLLAYAAQAAAVAALGLSLILLVRRRPHAAAEGPALVAASLLATPFLFDYDLVLLAIPLAWLFGEGRRGGFLPWEKLVLLAGYMLPLFVRTFARDFGLPLGPLVIASLYVCVLRRGFATPVAP
jgi:hypothetical protein